MRRILILIALTLPAVGGLRGAEITGIIGGVSGDVVSVSAKGELNPSVGDKAEIFFKIEGVEEEISVATAHVLQVEGESIQLKIENATGEVAKDQLVRITSANPQKRAAIPSSTPAILSATPVPPVEIENTPSPTQTLPPSVPFPSVTPKTKTASAPENQVDPAAAQHVNQGIAQYSAGNIDGAIASYTAALRISPSLAVAYLNRANAYLYKPNFNAAVADANRALELKVAKADDAYVIRATAKAGLGDYDSAIADCNRAIKINPRHALAYNNRANDKIRKRDYSGALADCNKSISIDASSGLPYYNRGFAYYNLGNAAAALSDWKKAVAKQSSFGAELNPKIAQLEAQGPARAPVPAREPVYNAPAAAGSQWVDLTNAPRKIVGTWLFGSSRTRFSADGTFANYAAPGQNPIRGQWQIQGDRLVQSSGNNSMTHQILSLDGRTLVIRNGQGQSFTLAKQK